MFYKFMKGIAPPLIDNITNRNSNIHNYQTRQHNRLHIPVCRTTMMSRTFRHKGVQTWNNLIDNVDSNCTFPSYKKKLKYYLLGN